MYESSAGKIIFLIVTLFAYRILGGKNLSLDTNQPKLHASVRKEEHMRTGDYKSHICDIINFQDKIMVWNPETNMVTARAEAVELDKMPRNTKQTRDDSVTDYMYGIVFTITLTVANKEYDPQVRKL